MAPELPGDGAPRISLVCTTVGRPVEFARLLASVEASDAVDAVELILVDQSADQATAAVLSQGERRVRVLATTSGRGASRGRNAGLRLATAPLVGFPDDNCWYPPGTLSKVLQIFTEEPGLTVLSGRQTTLDGRPSMLRWLTSPRPVTRRNLHRTTIMSTMFFERAAVDSAGGFDEGMGVGSEGWYGAGEESDLLLKILRSGQRAYYDPALVVFQDEPRDAADEAYVTKMLRYGCGMGHLWRLHRLPADQLLWYSARKLAAFAVRTVTGRRAAGRADLAYLRGTLAGVMDRPPRRLARSR